MKIGIYGGSFNPIHIGHLILAEYVVENFGLDKIIFIPVGIPSHRENNLLLEEHRFEMVKKAINSNSKFEISEIEKGKISYTYETYLELKKIYPNDDLYEIIGEDSAEYLDKWKDYDKMIKEIKFIVLKRRKHNFLSNQKNIFVLKSPNIEISSTQIRENLVQGKSIRYLVTEEVEDYIVTNNLYEK